MPHEIITPENEAHWLRLRTYDLTSTDVAALFGLSPYLTHFELWHRKKGNVEGTFQANQRMTWGNRLEGAIARGVADDQGWQVEPMKQYHRLSQLRLGSSFDFRFKDSMGSDGILEIKNVDWLAFRDQWQTENDGVEAPAHIEVQVQHQMLVSGMRRAAIAALVGGNDVCMLEREADDDVQRAITAKAADFWASIDEGREPLPDYAQDYDTLAKLHSHAEPGKFRDARDDQDLAGLCASYHDLGKQEKAIKESRRALKSQILVAAGDNEKLLVDGFTVGAGYVRPTMIEAYERAGYRNVRLHPRK